MCRGHNRHGFDQFSLSRMFDHRGFKIFPTSKLHSVLAFESLICCCCCLFVCLFVFFSRPLKPKEDPENNITLEAGRRFNPRLQWETVVSYLHPYYCI